MNDRRTSHYESDNDDHDVISSTAADANASGDDIIITPSQHRTPRPRGGDGDNNENSFGSSLDLGNGGDVDVEDNGRSNGSGSTNEKHTKWSPDMKIDENFDIGSPVVAGIAHGANDVVVNHQQQQLLSPRSQSQSSAGSTTFLNSSPRLTKYLCIASVFLVFCSLGLATAGLGLIYSTNRSNNDANDLTSQQTPSSTGGEASFDNVDKEVTTPTTASVLALDMKVDDVIDEDETNAKSRLTEEPTMSPTVLEETTEAEPVDSGAIVPISAIESNSTNTTSTTTTTQSDEDHDDHENPNKNTTSTSSNTNSTPGETSTVLFVPETLLSTTLYAIADTFLEQNSTQAYGRVKRLKVDAVPARASLLKFNLSTITIENNIKPKDVVGYSLRLYSLASSPYGGKIDVLKRNCNSWNEANITWDNAPRCVFQNNSNLVGEFEKEIPEFEWNEALLYMNKDIFEAQVITLRVTSHYADGVMYASRENDTAIPELVVYYTSTSSSLANNVTFVPTQSPIIGEISTLTPSSSPEQETMNSTSSNTPSATSSPSITAVPTIWPTYFPTSSPTSNGTVSPTAFPTTTPDDIIMPVLQDAMIRGGEYSNSRYGLDPFVALTGLERKALLEFDLSTANVRPNVDYEYTLQMYVSYVAENDQRSVTASCIAPQMEYTWDEFDISWNTYGSPSVNEIGWFTIFLDDMESLVSIPLGSLTNCTSSDADRNKFTLVMEIEDSDGRGDKFDFRSREYGDVFPGMVETPPVLIGVPYPQV